jgi:hypothetical protein
MLAKLGFIARFGLTGRGAVITPYGIEEPLRERNEQQAKKFLNTLFEAAANKRRLQEVKDSDRVKFRVPKLVLITCPNSSTMRISI